MILDWFNAREAAEVGSAFADEFSAARQDPAAGLQKLLQRANSEVSGLKLNTYKKARFANSFKWRLIENGIDRQVADEVTQSLVLHLSQIGPAANRSTAVEAGGPAYVTDVKLLLAQGNQFLADGAYIEAMAVYRNLLAIDPHRVEALNNLGAALCKIGRTNEAEEYFRQATRINPAYADAHNNLGNVLRWKGLIVDAEVWLRHAVKLNPKYADARTNLGLTLIFLGRLKEAEGQFNKVLKLTPHNAEALFGMGRVAAIQGRFDEAEAMFKRALEANPMLPSAWAGMSSLRKMTSSDTMWLTGAEKVIESGLAPVEKAELCFAVGKYHDDIKDFKRAFQSYERANGLLKTMAEPYDRAARTAFVDDMVRIYTRAAVSEVPGNFSDSTKPVFVVGMPRSGTSLAEQIIASHPSARGAGELSFWSDVVLQHESAVRQGLLGESTRKSVIVNYLRILESHGGDARRIVDKAPVNSDYLGLIHSIFPNARFVHMRRDPIDTCLSCYFQQFSVALNYTLDLSDLAHYCREHQRLIQHWRTVLPPESFLDVPYAKLVADQEGWTRKILEFIGLDWNEQCLNFQNTKRAVVTSSYWQVRQRMYRDSVARWHSYKKFIRPLLALQD